LHDWSDEECVNILKRCKGAIASKGKEGKVIIIDVVINQEKEEHDWRENNSSIVKFKLEFKELIKLCHPLVRTRPRSVYARICPNRIKDLFGYRFCSGNDRLKPWLGSPDRTGIILKPCIECQKYLGKGPKVRRLELKLEWQSLN
jgi:hypothetical protein